MMPGGPGCEPEFRRVEPSAEELVAYAASHYGRRPTCRRVQCCACGVRVWSTGLGIGNHRRACKGAPRV